MAGAGRRAGRDRSPVQAQRRLHLPGGGHRQLQAGRSLSEAPALVLLHGWTSTAAITWRHALEPLRRQYEVVAPDLRGHGTGVRSDERATLDAAVGDVAALIETLDRDRVIVAGWSMGGSIAQLLWRDHRELVDGLVLCASTRTFMGTARERVRHESIRVAAALARATNDDVACRVALRIMRHLYGDEGLQHRINVEMRKHSWRQVLELGVDLGRFRSHDWVSGVDVPTAVLVTMKDTWVPVERQIALAHATRAAIVRVDGDHAVCLNEPAKFVPAMLEACQLATDEARPSSMSA